MPDSFDYTTGTNSENVRLLQALIDEAPEYTEETNSRNANILKSIINNTEYTDAPQSEIEELLLRLKAKIGGEIEVDELNVTENGTYDAGVNKAYNPVNVELPLSSKTITENGTYTASDDNLAGFNEVTVAVEGYAKKSIANTPTPIATFNASALPMPSLNVSIEAVQSGTGDPSPTNIRPISGFSAVDVYRCGKNLLNPTIQKYSNPFVVYGGTIASNVPDGSLVLKAGTYTISVNKNIYTIEVRDNPNNTIATGQGNILTFTLDAEKAIKIALNKGNEDIKSLTFQLEKGSTASTYEPYSGQTYTTTLKDGQGNPLTCYGGELSNENGVQTLTNGRAKLTNDYLVNTASYESAGRGCFVLIGITLKSMGSDVLDTKLIASALKTSTQNDLFTNKNVGIAHWWNTRIGFSTGDETITTVSAFKQWLTDNGSDVVYPLATPQQIPQDNLAIATQDGTNNLWADSGDIQSGEYMEAL